MKYPPRTMPINPNMPKFLLKLPCVRCMGTPSAVHQQSNGHSVPMCSPCGYLPLTPQQGELLKTLAYHLNILAGDYMGATLVITRRNKKIFPE